LQSNEIFTIFVMLKDKRTSTHCLTQKSSKMSDEEFAKEVKDLVDMLNNLRRIKDKGRRPWFKAEIKEQLRKLLKD